MFWSMILPPVDKPNTARNGWSQASICMLPLRVNWLLDIASLSEKELFGPVQCRFSFPVVDPAQVSLPLIRIWPISYSLQWQRSGTPCNRHKVKSQVC